jgi:hypothetical protein
VTGRTGWVTETLLRLAPAPWRQRFRSEILAHLSSSDHRMRDTVNVTLTALGLRADQIRRSRHMMKIAVAILVVGAVWTAWAVPQLAEGVTELPGHWWSAPGPTLVLTGGMLAALGAYRRHRSS